MFYQNEKRNRTWNWNRSNLLQSSSREALHMQKAMERLFCNRTVIIIAHRLKTLEHVDCIMLMEQGNVVEYGDYLKLSWNPASRIYGLLNQNVSEVLA